jgi:hypothetical protein
MLISIWFEFFVFCSKFIICKRMKTLSITLLGGLLCFTQLSLAQVPAFPYNPDIDSNAFIELTDLLYFLDLYGQPWSFSDEVSEPGDMMYFDAYENDEGDIDSAWIRLPIGSAGQILTVSNGIPQWNDPAEILLSAFPCLESLCNGGGDIILGCTVDQACNYNPAATLEDGTCDFISCLIFGCTDPIACNYDLLAEYADGTCQYATFPFDCNGDCLGDDDGDGICDEFEIFGCIDSMSCNYFIGATNDDGSCTYDCYGCIDPSACNFGSSFLIDDGSCEYISCLIHGCTDVNACNYYYEAAYDDGSCEYILPGNCDCSGNQLDALDVCGGLCSEDLDADDICDDVDDCVGEYDICGNCNGNGICDPEACNPIGGYSVGDIGPAGGVIIYDNGEYTYTDYDNSSYDCWRYIEVSTEVLPAQVWGCYATNISGLSNSIGSGEINTKIILGSGCAEVSPTYAALSASLYLGGGMTDWFLPSPAELILLADGGEFDFTASISGWELGSYWTSDQFMNVGYLGTFIEFSDDGQGGIQTTISGTNVNVSELQIIPMRRF